MGKTYLVTGGAGFIGSSIVKELLRRDEKVRILDNFSTGKQENIADVLRCSKREYSKKEVCRFGSRFSKSFEIIEGDVRNFKTVRNVVDGVDYILHQAALPSVPRSIKYPVIINEVNVGGTLNLLEAGRKAGVKRFVCASSSSIYGNSKVLPKNEDMDPDPVSPYAVSKLAAEKYCKVFSSIYGLETVCLRYFNVFGPRQNPASQYSAVIPRFIKLILEGKHPTIYGDGKQSRDFTFVGNVVDATLKACTARDVSGKVFNVACGKSAPVNALVNLLNNIIGTTISPVYLKERRGEVKHSLADITMAKEQLDYSPKVDFEEGLEKTVAWYQKTLEGNE